MSEYTDIPPPPNEVNACAILVRLVDGIAFRYRWATEELSERSLMFQPSDDTWNLQQLLEHVRGLASWVAGSIGATLPEVQKHESAMVKLRDETIALFVCIREHFLCMEDEGLEKIVIEGKIEDYPFWNLINGPFADILTHIGQISAWRRMHGHPQPKANVFTGTAPQDSSGET